jgi:hypothetical protein
MYIMHAVYTVLNISKPKIIISWEDDVCKLNENNYFEYSVPQFNC